MSDQIDPAMWSRPELQPVLIGHDIGAGHGDGWTYQTVPSSSTTRMWMSNEERSEEGA